MGKAGHRRDGGSLRGVVLRAILVPTCILMLLFSLMMLALLSEAVPFWLEG
jgi:hypothetical protein